MDELTLFDIKAFHRDLLSISGAGVALAGSPLEEPASHTLAGWFGRRSLDAEVHLLRESLLLIEQRLAAASLEGCPLAEALESHAHVSPHYIAALRIWQTSEHAPAAFDRWAAAAQRVGRRQWNLRIASVQPIVWLVVSYLGLSFISQAIAPLFLALSRQMHVEPGLALSTLLNIRAAYPVWGVGVPLLVLALTWALYVCRLPAGWFTRPSQRSLSENYSQSVAAAEFAILEYDDQRQPVQPSAGWVLLGGVLVLGIALCVFGPLVELLYSVAAPLGLCWPVYFLIASGA